VTHNFFYTQLTSQKLRDLVDMFLRRAAKCRCTLA